jgi:hypothetical protein
MWYHIKNLMKCIRAEFFIVFVGNKSLIYYVVKV